MSEENVEMVRRPSRVKGGFEAYWEGPAPRRTRWRRRVPAAAVEWLLHDVEWTALTGTTYRGYNGLARGFDQTGRRSGLRHRVQEVSALGGDKVLAVLRRYAGTGGPPTSGSSGI